MSAGRRTADPFRIAPEALTCDDARSANGLLPAPAVQQEVKVVHRHGCEEPGWVVATSKAISSLAVARCSGCGAIALAGGGVR